MSVEQYVGMYREMAKRKAPIHFNNDEQRLRIKLMNKQAIKLNEQYCYFKIYNAITQFSEQVCTYKPDTTLFFSGYQGVWVKYLQNGNNLSNQGVCEDKQRFNLPGSEFRSRFYSTCLVRLQWNESMIENQLRSSQLCLQLSLAEGRCTLEMFAGTTDYTQFCNTPEFRQKVFFAENTSHKKQILAFLPAEIIETCADAGLI
ncbi:MAG: hypothetical protein Q8P53_03530 [Candidatus Shapirobacteria bacterium]|nr:hypothetical protein [Candidatus Shapirobacteria bacterium]